VTAAQTAMAVVVWAVGAAVAFPLRPWQTHHPRETLLAWSVLVLLGYALAGLVACQVVLAAATPLASPDPRTALGYAAGWAVLLVVGAVWAWVFTQAEEFIAIDDAADAVIEELRHASAYATEQRGSWRITFLRSDRPTAWTHPSRREVLLTSALVTHLSASEVSAVIAHEEHHVQARHPLMLRVSRLHAASIPLAWVAAVHRRTRLLIELAADDHAARRCGIPATAGALDQIAALTGNDSAALRAYRLRVRAEAVGGTSDPARG